MNPTVSVELANPDPNVDPQSLPDLWAILNATVHGELDGGDNTSYLEQPGIPSVDDEGKAWVELSSGKPLSLKIFFNGVWRRAYNGMLGEIRMYSGPPGGDTDPTFDKDGKGKAGGQYDGWQICNGNNGSPDMSDQFIIGAHMNKALSHPDYADGWVTFADAKNDLQSGGSKDHKIVAQDLPPINPGGLTAVPPEPTSSLIVHGFKYVAGNTKTPAQPIVDRHYGNMLTHTFPITSYGANPPDFNQNALPTVPPYLAMAFIIFIGY
jgi:hypothetical protein